MPPGWQNHANKEEEESWGEDTGGIHLPESWREEDAELAAWHIHGASMWDLPLRGSLSTETPEGCRDVQFSAHCTPLTDPIRTIPATPHLSPCTEFSPCGSVTAASCGDRGLKPLLFPPHSAQGLGCDCEPQFFPLAGPQCPH